MTSSRVVPVDPRDDATITEIARLATEVEAVDRPWHVGYPAVFIRMLATYGWDDQPDQFVVVWAPGGRMVAAGSVVLPERDNRDIALLWGRVHPDHHLSQGHGSALYDHLEAMATDAGRTKLFTSGPESEPGRRFAERRGYALGSVGIERRVVLSEGTTGEVQALFDEARPHASDYELLRFVGSLPDELLEAYVEAASAINDAPLDDLDIEDEVFDAARVRRYEDGQRRSRHRLYRVIARHRETGTIAGHTVVAVELDRPSIGYQHDTTVVREHRGHRLGLLLKADMMRWLRQVEPELRTIDTHNAASNDHMIAVNQRLGYQVMGTSLEFQKDPAPASSHGAGTVTGTA